ncbi:glycerol-3-phosphate 1-O-acyltransferase PlsY [Methylotenera sp.]|uniref:glycerol-3-phosphate 1-O-acyltransferase PlsY n=1 Tax=Methylotenera sp. TaxID=2051956 RepID=UPI0027193305|nr:glycerol-3-phosphate 1-O-acyltransferase PlsY [Methylotenera sp.]MDO9206460.1 glycerol-3-phosphate 1-O-acyltransferase PlsY [Methylotenera sp.]MDP2070664.1 glycerol-3-phosphate 1-O-acyltransferase PlsY [Methylotenera sp.]MDP3004855.1 glycerol-3-phosphate 1-O-acyltransferase PlsY [Methylotenera sp.]
MNELGFIPVTLIPVIWIVAAYLLGSVAFGIIVSKLFGLPDPRTVGSGNPGATNVLRSGKKLAAALTLLGDVVKGLIPVWLALRSDMLMWVVASVGLAVFIGHLYPIFYKFKGGKGVATALGVMLALSPLLGLAAIVTWVLVFAIFRYSSLAAIMAAALAPVYAWFLLSAYKDYFITVLVMAVFLIWRHKTNIEKLLTGTESGFGKK